MGKFTEYIGSQFGNPRGFVGTCCCFLMNVFNRAMYRQVLTQLNMNQESKILDIGYGNGYLLKRIDQEFSPMLYGIDPSEDMMLLAHKHNKKAFQENRLQLSVGDCCSLPFPDDFFECVTSINTIYFWKDTALGLSEIHRVLKKHGNFCNVVYSQEWLQKLSYTQKGFRLFHKEDLCRMGEAAGFSLIEAKDIVHGKSYMVLYTK